MRVSENARLQICQQAVYFATLLSVLLDPRRHDPRPGEVQQARDPHPGGRPGDLQGQEGLLQDQVRAKNAAECQNDSRMVNLYQLSKRMHDGMNKIYYY